MPHAGNCNDALDNVGGTEQLVQSSARVIDMIDIMRRFVGSHEGAEQVLNALPEFESLAQPLMCANTQAKITDYFRN